jgi:hypothetical protein
MTRSPKQAFIDSPHRLEHETTTQKESFKAACEYALLQMVHGQSWSPINPSLNADSHNQLMGAKRVLEILSTIHQLEEEKKPVKEKALNYNL